MILLASDADQTRAPDARVTRLIANADRCVACGLCLPGCPTYQRTADESESPRGRVALMRAVAVGRLQPSVTLKAHIDHCLGCQACEAACPSRVPYGALLTDARALLASQPPKARLYHTLLRATQAPRLLALAYDAARLGTRAGLTRLLPRPLSALPRLPARSPYRRPRATAGGRPVSLFLGCTAHLDGDTLAAAMTILRHHGFAISIPHAQGCCGALARHAGDTRLADRQEKRTWRAFADSAGPVIGFASGCVAQLHAGRQEGKPRFPAAVLDIHQFLAEEVPATSWRLAGLPKTIAVHEPCSLRNALKSAEAVYTLLRYIPGARIVPLPGNDTCCGGAGDYFLREPVMATALRTAKRSAMTDIQADIIVSANIGCRLQMRLGETAPLPIVHPLVVLAGQLGKT